MMSRFTHLYHLTTWKQLRRAHLRKEPLCVMCMEAGFLRPGTVVDHKKPHRGDMTLFVDPANLQTLCASHHSHAKQIEEARGYRPGADASGHPTDPRHPWNSAGPNKKGGGVIEK